MIEIRHLRKEYPNVTPLKDVSATINDGDVIAIIGPSGTGKSTLIRCLNLLETPTAGQIFLNGEEITAGRCDVRQVRRQMGMVFQSFNLFGHLTAIENLMAAPMDLLKKSREEAYEKGMELLTRVGVADKAFSYPDELSGGQQQRVAIARTLCMDPEVLLLDEPTSALDPTMVTEVQAVIKELAESGKTMLIVTHEMNFAKAISNRVFYMDEGCIYEDGSPEQIFDHPMKQNTRRFVRKLRIFEQKIDSKNHDFIRMGAELDTYLLQNGVPSALRYRIRLAVEELVQQILLPHLRTPHIHLVAEYSLQDGSARLTASYGGDAWDIKETDNRLSWQMLQSTAQEITWQWDEGEEEPNRVNLTMRM